MSDSTENKETQETYRPYRKIFSVVKSEIFYKFSKRSKEDGFKNIGSALTRIVEAYSNGEISVVSNKSKKKEHAKGNGADYRKGDIEANG